ncbi:MAG: ribonuclease Z [Spirochaetales bacterium]|jgi:ribonuclease Z|nr:ribonuclease Z [Spirochaetales bacterium]
MNLETFILGTGGMMPLPGRHLTSILVRREGDLFLFDCGEGTQVSLRRLNLRWKKITAIFISHTHADHVTGLPGILMLSSQVDREEPLYIFGPPKIREYIEENRRVLDMFINYEIIIKELPQEKETVFKGEGFQIESFPLRHSKPCLGYNFVEDQRPGIFNPDRALALDIPRGPLWSILQRGENINTPDGREIIPSQILGKPRPGRKISFITDTVYFPQIAPNVQNADLLICEGMFTNELADSAREKKHLTSTQAAKIAAAAGGVKRLGLIHYSPRYTERELKQLLNEAKSNFPETFLTRDRQEINIPLKD